MTYHTIDNSLKNLGKAVLWQYDKAVRLLSLMKHMQVLFHAMIEQFWDFWRDKVLSIDNCGAFGCSIWGIFLGIQRPSVEDGSGGERPIATSVYRRLLKGAFYLMKANSSLPSLSKYVEIVFGLPGNDALSPWKLMPGLEYGWTTNIDEINGKYEIGIPYNKGYVFWYDAEEDGVGNNWKSIEDISASENTSWDAIRAKVVATTERTTYSRNNATILLKLYDPEGVCRKIGGTPNDSLSISVEYAFGETIITATATRGRKCGVQIIDNGDMSLSYVKSPYYDQMHQDQKYLYEKKSDEFCPAPLGVRTTEVTNPIVFWPAVDEKEISDSILPYEAATAYSKGDYIKFKLEREEFREIQGFQNSVYVSELFGETGYANIRGSAFVIGKAKRAISATENRGIESLLTTIDESEDNLVEIVEVWGENDGSTMAVYEEGAEYNAGEGFCVIDDQEGYTTVYGVTQDIKANENRSIKDIANKLERIDTEIPFPGPISDALAPYEDYATREKFSYYDNPTVIFRVGYPGVAKYLAHDEDGYRFVYYDALQWITRVDIVYAGASQQRGGSGPYTTYVEAENADSETINDILIHDPRIQGGFAWTATSERAYTYPPLPGRILSGTLIKIDEQWYQVFREAKSDLSKEEFLKCCKVPSQTGMSLYENMIQYLAAKPI